MSVMEEMIDFAILPLHVTVYLVEEFCRLDVLSMSHSFASEFIKIILLKKVAKQFVRLKLIFF